MHQPHRDELAVANLIVVIFCVWTAVITALCILGLFTNDFQDLPAVGDFIQRLAGYLLRGT